MPSSYGSNSKQKNNVFATNLDSALAKKDSIDRSSEEDDDDELGENPF